jgi:prophage antirepressor-like protein
VYDNKKESRINMENQLKIFSYAGNEIRTVPRDGETWWVLRDVCEILEISNSSNVAARLDADEKGVHTADTLGGKQELTIVSESGLYSVILLSRKPDAKKFKRWVTHEVLPSIRKHGLYAVDDLINNPDAFIAALQALKAERAEKALLAAQNETLEIALNDSLKYYTVAKYNRQFKMGWNMQWAQSIGKKMTAFCRANGYQIRECKTNDERFGTTNSYPITAWEEFSNRMAI